MNISKPEVRQIKKTKIVLIQKSLKQDLESAIKLHNRNYSRGKLKLDTAIYFVSLLNSIPTFTREDEEEKLGVGLSSKLLKKIDTRYKQYMDFLQRGDSPFINKVSNYGVDISCCNMFEIDKKYNFDQLVYHRITDKFLLRKFDSKGRDNHSLEKMRYCEKQRPHLTHFFNDNLSINTHEALKEVSPLLNHKDTYESGKTGLALISEINFKEWKYSMKEYSDNRFHSNLTRCPKILRKHIKFNKKRLIGIDLKTSQPFFLSVIITAIAIKDRSLLSKIGLDNILTDDIIDSLFSLELDLDNLRDFVRPVLHGDFYNELVTSLEFQYDENGLVQRNVFNKTNTKKRRKGKKSKLRKIVKYESKRDCVKALVMEFLFSSTKSTVPELKIIRDRFPSLIEIINEFSRFGIKLHRVLQYVESHILLDNISLAIHHKYPNMPIFSIHDSLLTTIDWAEILESEMTSQIKQVTLLKPNVSIEPW